MCAGTTATDSRGIVGLTRWARRIAVATVALSVVPAITATAATTPPPAPPAIVAVVTGSTTLGVSWTEATAGATFVAKATATDRVTRTCTVKVDKCTIASVANGVTYTVTVVASTKKGGASAPSASVTATVGVPGPPTAVKVRAAKVLAVVKWSAPVVTGVSATTGFTATASPSGLFCVTVSTLLTPAAHTCTITGLTKLTTYSFSVTAHNRFGTGVPSKVVTVTTT
jgi:hypothetical protein